MTETEAERIKRLAVYNLLCAYPNSRGSNWGEVIEGYVTALSRMAPSLVEAACSAGIRGKIGKPAFIPTAAELYQYAEALQLRIDRAAKEDKRPWVKMPDPPREPVPFDPSSKTFNPSKLGMTQEQVIRCVIAYRAGEDWELVYRQAKLKNDLLANRWQKLHPDVQSSSVMS